MGAVARENHRMSRPDQELVVIAHAGYRGEQEPRLLWMDGRRLRVVGIERQWQTPDGRVFEVVASDGIRYVVHCDVDDETWSLVSQSG